MCTYWESEWSSHLKTPLFWILGSDPTTANEKQMLLSVFFKTTGHVFGTGLEK